MTNFEQKNYHIFQQYQQHKREIGRLQDENTKKANNINELKKRVESMNSTYKNLQQEFAAIQKKDQENAKKLLEFQQKEKNKRNIEGTISNHTKNHFS